MGDVLIPLALTVIATAVATTMWRRGRRVTGAVVGLIAVGAALVAMRDLPGPVVVGLLVAVLVAVAVVTVWPWLARLRRAGSRPGEHR